MKKQIILSLAFALPLSTSAQSADRQVLGSSGSSYSGTTLQADYTTGEAVTISGSSGTFSVHQGFQQNDANPSGIKGQNVMVNYTLFPNPAQDLVTLSLTVQNSIELKISLANSIGQVISADQKAEKINASYKREISLNALASGIYFVNLFDNKNALLHSIKFIKQ
ncbi:MAG: T9SS type A sorting domain-containing protein [Bacteroidota bacterium]